MNFVLPLKDIYRCSVNAEVGMINDFIVSKMGDYVERVRKYVDDVSNGKDVLLSGEIKGEELDSDTITLIVSEINNKINDGVRAADIFIAEIDSADMLALTPSKRFHLTLTAVLASLEDEHEKVFKLEYTAYGIRTIEV